MKSGPCTLIESAGISTDWTRTASVAIWISEILPASVNIRGCEGGIASLEIDWCGGFAVISVWDLGPDDNGEAERGALSSRPSPLKY